MMRAPLELECSTRRDVTKCSGIFSIRTYITGKTMYICIAGAAKNESAPQHRSLKQV
jgi:hypothetical protein